MRLTSIAFLLAISLSPIPRAGADVLDTQASGFLSKNEVMISAPRDRVFEALTRRVGRWWDPEHTYSGNAGNMSIEAIPGGCFCERIPDKGWIEHMRVIYVSKNEVLRLSGALGPLHDSGLAGSLTWALSITDRGTRVEQTYSVGGYYKGGFAEIAVAVDSVLAIQLSRLKSYVESGRPDSRSAR